MVVQTLYCLPLVPSLSQRRLARTHAKDHSQNRNAAGDLRPRIAIEWLYGTSGVDRYDMQTTLSMLV